ncbi:MAG: FAD-binding oxidoreductase, partial [Chloroflexi bacterium]|nr:FAD-binding oxidoreductase [Chloroflexota bacterium]
EHAARASYAIEELRARIGGPVFTPSDEGYDDARSIWNAMIDKRPAAIARCTGTADIIQALSLARDAGAPLSTRAGGHNIGGTALCDDGIVVDLSHLKGIHVDLPNETVRVQPGVLLGDIDRETQAFGRIVPSGFVSQTGLSGLTLGGGFGWLTRKWGLTSDHLISADVVTVDGDLVRASENENADLFWGLRGGGGNFGIVASYEYQMRKHGPTVMAGLVAYPMDRANDVISFYREFSEAASDDLTCVLLLRVAPAAPFLPADIHGKPVALIIVCHAGPLDEAEKAVRPLKEFGSPVADTIEPKPFAVHQAALDATQPPGRYYYWKSDYMSAVTEAAQETILERTAKFPSPESALIVFQLGGAAARIDDGISAAAHRDAAYVLNIASSCIDADKIDACKTWARHTWSAMRPHSTGGAYVNFLTEDEGDDRTMEAYGKEKYDRLAAIKTKYDPANFFRVNRNIAPA